MRKVVPTQAFATLVNGRPASFGAGTVYEMDDAEADRFTEAGLVKPYEDAEVSPSPVTPDSPPEEEPDKPPKKRTTKKVAAAPENKSE
jgi:hypothetical protein